MANKVTQTVVNFADLISVDELTRSINHLLIDHLIDIISIQYAHSHAKNLICDTGDVLMFCEPRNIAEQMLKKTFVLETHTGGKQSPGLMAGGVIDTSFDNIAKYLVNTKKAPIKVELPNDVIFSNDECKLAQCYYRTYYTEVNSLVINGRYEILHEFAQMIIRVASKIYDLIGDKMLFNNFRVVEKSQHYETVYLHPHHLIIIDLFDRLNAIRLLMDRIVCLHNVHNNRNLVK